jgi:hypothetical protein
MLKILFIIQIQFQREVGLHDNIIHFYGVTTNEGMISFYIIYIQ